MALPLNRAWRISGDALPARLDESDAQEAAFSLPGADALDAFADLLGKTAQDADAQDQPRSAPFWLPALIPEDMPGSASLTCEIDFSAHEGDSALLLFDMLCGSGEVYLQECPPRFGPKTPIAPQLLARFGSGPLTLTLTEALARRRRYQVTLCFDERRPAGVCGAVSLRIARRAQLRAVTIRPQASAQTLHITAEITAFCDGRFALGARLCPADGDAPQQDARETVVTLEAGHTRRVQLSMHAPAGAFAPGTPYRAPALKLWLSHLQPPAYVPEKPRRGLFAPAKPPVPPREFVPIPCDSMTMLCGYPAAPSPCFMPLTAAQCLTPADALLRQLSDLHISSVSLPCAAPDMLYRALTRAGIGARQSALLPAQDRERIAHFPCVAFDESLLPRAEEAVDPLLSAWQMIGLITYPRTPDPSLTPADMCFDLAGRALSPEDGDVAAVLEWLRAVSLRMRNEAIRQGRLQGAHCAPGEWEKPDVFDAIETAMRPLHLSALPLCGAWWTGNRFSASLSAMIPSDETRMLRAEAVLEDAQGEVLARFDAPCPKAGGPLGLIEATLPDAPCALELITRLYAGKSVIEESSMPVYVGHRGALEAAF